MGSFYKSKAGKVLGMLKFDYAIWKASLRFKPDIFLSHGSIYAAQVAFLLGKPNIAIEDTGNKEQVNIYKPITKAILTSDIFRQSYGEKQVRYHGYHELAYLHPAFYQPDPSIYNLLGIEPGFKYAVIRFVSWRATHDAGQSGLDYATKIKLVEELSKRLKVFITSEEKLPPEIAQFQINIPPEKIFDAMYYASLFVGEGATMASESGVLGTRAVYINSLQREYCEDQEQYGLVYNFSRPDGVIRKAIEILDENESKDDMLKRRQKLLDAKINVTDFLVWFVENFPESLKIMKADPTYDKRFR